MQRALELTVAYAKTRKQFGKPIGIFQAVQHLCADMYLETESSRSATYYAAWALEENVPDAAAAVSVAKMYASDASRTVGNRGIQVHGGMGFTWENDLHLYYRRAKASETMLGDATFHRERIARLVIDGLRPAGAQDARSGQLLRQSSRPHARCHPPLFPTPPQPPLFSNPPPTPPPPPPPPPYFAVAAAPPFLLSASDW